MRIIAKKLAGYLMAAMLALTSLTLPVTASANSYDYMAENTQPTGGEMLADAFLLRPAMLVGSVFTVATFVVTLPFSALGGNVGEAAQKLVVEPLKYTFVRPLGDI
jgi:hypothetical protein